MAHDFKQKISYLYNPRGWLSQISDPDNVTALSAFGMQLSYNEVGTGKQFNGNIAYASWQTMVPGGSGLFQQKQSFTYTYDALNRLENAGYNNALVEGNKFNEALTYDKMGNILTLKRKDVTTTNVYRNDFTYNYTSGGTGSRLWSVADIGTANQDGSYTYDGNGNVLSDTRNQVTGTVYNLLNLPQTLVRPVPGNITYFYDATGSKLRKSAPGGTRDYIGGIEYNGTAIEQIATEEGRAVPNGAAAYTYQYAIKDHLGNTRAMVDQAGAITQVQDYYAFGLEMNPGNGYTASPDNRYKYNGKEKQDETGLYDYGARFYDPVVGRWMMVDPLADMSQNMSGYIYGNNNPILLTDPFGMAADSGKVLPEVTITGFKKTINEFMNRALFMTSIMNPFKHFNMQRTTLNTVDNANNLSQLIRNSLGYVHHTKLSGQLLGKVKADKNMIAFKQKIIKLLKADNRFGKFQFRVDDDEGDVVAFAGDAWSSASNFGSVASNELTWSVRNARVSYSAIVKIDGTIVINFHMSDTLDLSPQTGRGWGYNGLSAATGAVYHDLMGGNPEMKVTADWQENVK